MEKSILLCDDDFIMLKLIEDKLLSYNYKITTVSDGKKAIDKLQNSDFDLIVTDMHMPYATGMELIDFLKNDLKKNTPIIVITKDTSENTAENAFNIGATDYIFKPVNVNILAKKIENILANN